jgi:hypothetical protein
MTNFGVEKDGDFDTSFADSYFSGTKAYVDYSQYENSGSQVMVALTRTQVTIDALGPRTDINELLWNPINNRINFIDANVGDYVDVNVALTFTLGGLINVQIELDYSLALDGSLLAGGPSNISIIGSATPDVLLFNFKFVVSSEMKENGIGIMATPSVGLTFPNTILNIEKNVITKD